MIVKALLRLRPGCEFRIENDDYENMYYSHSLPKPSWDEIQLEILKIQKEWQDNEYQRLRAAAFPSIAEQLDMQYWDLVNGTHLWEDMVTEIKNKYPKPGAI